jgi:hypothetical protein
MFDSSLKVIFALFVVAILLFVVPFLLIWSLNTLFPVLAIPYTLETWLASVLISSFFGTSHLSMKKSSK